jgi:hypothetical protein
MGLLDGLLLLAFVLALPALLTALRLLRAQRLLGSLFWRVTSLLDSPLRGDSAESARKDADRR